MPSHAGDAARWDERIARARRLAAEHADAAAILTFYAAIAEYQASLLVKKGSGVFFASKTLGEKDSRPLFHEPVLAAIPDFLVWLQQRAPAHLAAAAGEMRALDRSRWEQILDSYLIGDPDVTEREGVAAFVVEVVLQPFAEQRAKSNSNSESSPSTHSASSGSTVTRSVPSSPSRCPTCGGSPVLGVLREEGHGAKRTLLCGLCLTEHDYLRVVCPACDEQRFDALPVYSADQFAHVRIDACDTCHIYLKTIDSTKDGLAVPLADDLASVSLDLWARERGYVRLRPNLLRV